eukprot:TRINITY_DN3712_c0_g1_i1.p1 TRINITY_DN3712_c0_g1~~TRINITY_DN3712_c0_g1_i1.p1  ORF type:complete len:334 (-),score=74.27 TRINITY_DN3712_c0_g1_i1:97-1098(-)
MEHDFELSGPFSVLRVCSGTHSDDDTEARQRRAAKRKSKRTKAREAGSGAPLSDGHAKPGSVYCSICLTEHDDMLTVASVPTCSHQFCIPCLRAWLTHRTVCPLCFRDVDAVLTSEKDSIGAVQTVIHSLEMFAPQEVSEPVTVDDPAVLEALLQYLPTDADDLMCLDSNYFIPEIERLILIAEIIEREAAVTQRRGPSYAHKARVNLSKRRMRVLQENLRFLYDLQNLMTSPRYFDPRQVLLSLYQIQDALVELSTDPFARALWEDDAGATVPATNTQNTARAQERDGGDSYFDLSDDDAEGKASRIQKKRKQKAEKRREKALAQMRTLEAV